MFDRDVAGQSCEPAFADTEAKNATKRGRILILQGPVGPFFRQLHKRLLTKGFSVRKVNFNAADDVFSTGMDCFHFAGNLKEWQTWLRFELSLNTPDAIVLFGCNRPAHKVAQRMASGSGIPVISLEEGYIRAGYIACELGGNNQCSRLQNWIYDEGEVDVPSVSAPINSSFLTMCFWGAGYYLIRDAFSSRSDEATFHRTREKLLWLSISWLAHGFRRVAYNVLEVPKRSYLKGDNDYILVPLQVPSDSQIVDAGLGWNSHKLIDACLDALKQSHHRQKVVFKTHPLDRSGRAIKQIIHKRAKQLGLLDRVRVMHTGHIGELTKHASGMVVINSTSAFSALHHNVPILVLGEAVFRHEQVVTCGETAQDVKAFFHIRQVKDRTTVDAFVNAVKSESLIAGDYYSAKGRVIALSGVLASVKKQTSSSLTKKIAAE